jgi:hypothetical protein
MRHRLRQRPDEEDDVGIPLASAVDPAATRPATVDKRGTKRASGPSNRKKASAGHLPGEIAVGRTGFGICPNGGEGEVQRIQRLDVASRTALVTVAVGAIMTLAACGSEVVSQSASAGQSASAAQSASAGQRASAGATGAPGATSSRTHAQVALCTDTPRLTSLVVSRTSGFRDSQLGSLLPRGITIMEPGLVRGLAAALCGLPEMPRIALTCPAQFGGGSLRFGFAAGDRAFPPVVVQVSGCRVVTGLGPVRRASSAAFWRTVDQDLGSLASSPRANTSGGIRP